MAKILQCSKNSTSCYNTNTRKINVQIIKRAVQVIEYLALPLRMEVEPYLCGLIKKSLPNNSFERR